MLSYFILLQSKLPSKAETDKIAQLADGDGCISKEAF